VTFKVESEYASREFALVFKDGAGDVALEHCKNGWCSGKPSREDENDENAMKRNQLIKDAEEDAKQFFRGKHTCDPLLLNKAVRNKSDSRLVDDFLDSKGVEPIDCVVEVALNGSTMKVCVCEEGPARGAEVTILLAGVVAPAMGKKNEKEPEAHAREAKYFAELNVLNRDVRVAFVGKDKYGNRFASVLPKDDHSSIVPLANALLERGLAKVSDYSAALALGGASPLRMAEAIAKTNRIRIWQDYFPLVEDSAHFENMGRSRNLVGKVIEVVSGDSVIIEDSQTGEEMKVMLSSVRAPRIAPLGRGARERSVKDEPYAREAKEFVRTRVIGKKVEVHFEYTKAIAGNDSREVPEKIIEFGTIALIGEAVKKPPRYNNHGIPIEQEPDDVPNLAELLVVRGLASVVRHRENELRSHRYDDLLVAESKAIQLKKGVHSPKDAPIPHDLNDASENVKKATQFLPFLQRAGKFHGVVEHCINGHRFRVSSQNAGAVFTLSLSGVRCPTRDEPFAKEALNYVRSRVNQREVQVAAQSVDKTGTFRGTLECNTLTLDLASELVRAGLARVSFHGDASAIEVEKAAKIARVGIWIDWDEEAEETRRLAEEMQANSLGYDNQDPARFYVRNYDDENRNGGQAPVSGGTINAPPGYEGVKAGYLSSNNINNNTSKNDQYSTRFNGNASDRKSSAAVSPAQAAGAARDSGPPVFTTRLGVTETLQGGKFFAQILERSVANELWQLLQKEYANDDPEVKAPPPGFEPKLQEVVAIKSSEDNSWYRATINNRNDSKKEVDVMCIDFGHNETINIRRVRPLHSNVSLNAFPPQARLCQLAHVSMPGFHSDYKDVAEAEFQRLIHGGEFHAVVDARMKKFEFEHAWSSASEARPELTLTLWPLTDAEIDSNGPKLAKPYSKDDFVPENSIQGILASSGLCKMSRFKVGYTQTSEDNREAILAEIDRARREHTGMFEYGDVDSDREY
jgi:endonuclease YncB( thermonuclease family)